ncbi:hypothetical protein SAMN02745119_00947 [Trichlorobacter thiogenes]|uniref:Uncharacterized protein n=1 Tax=Trichlorobacter thiogenes TaxID=115783 RepID=A0A1T4LM75_9BACT|nr:hypothetical protein [Trichlorobacter thiogenes]SJZ55544.1 hypothetical protein SAMN02745119_00947 [Trichlorobacter thiogenes]
MADPTTVPAWVPIVSAVAGGLVVGAFGAINNFISKKTEEKKLESEERRHLKEQVVKAAIEYWYKHHELVKSANGRLPQITPLDTYLVHIAAVMAEIMDTKLTPENVPAMLERAHQISKAAYDQAGNRASNQEDTPA